MFTVDTGLYQGNITELQNQILMQFSDINSDMFTDIIAVDGERQTIIMHVFDAATNNYTQKVSFRPNQCSKILNVIVGRSDKTLRLYVTCLSVSHPQKTILKMFDRNMNNEMTATVIQTNKDSSDPELKIIDTLVQNTHMVYKKDNNIKSISFIEVPQQIVLTQNSQPFVGDLNGDQIDDIIFNNENPKNASQGKLNVAIYNKSSGVYDISSFKETMVDQSCGGVPSQIAAPQLTTPHSVSMLDFDGDCMSDLFLTVQDASKSKVFYEIYVRRE